MIAVPQAHVMASTPFVFTIVSVVVLVVDATQAMKEME